MVSLPAAQGLNANLSIPRNDSVESFDYPVMSRAKPNIHLKELSYFLKVLEAKAKFDPQLVEGLPISMR